MHTIGYRKTYLSLAVSRALAAEYPVGDPHGGPAYGERNAPAIAAVAAVVSNFSVVSMIGAALSVVGMVTGNETLTKIGGIVGLAGGVFSMAQNGVFGAGAQEWAQGVSESFGQTVAQGVSDAAAPAVSDVVGAAAEGAADVVGQSVPSMAESGVDLNLAQASTPQAGMSFDFGPPVVEGSGGLMQTPTEVGGAVGAAGDFGPPVVDAGGGAVSNLASAELVTTPLQQAGLEGVTDSVTKAVLNGNYAGVDQAANSGFSLDKLLTENRKELWEVGLKGLQGLLTDDSAKEDALKAQANLYNAKAAEAQRQQANANAVPNIAGMFSVNPNAAIAKKMPLYTPGVRPGGLIQSR